jgi:hypothetical protein
MVFDIKITTPNSVFWIDVTEIPSFVENYLPYVPIYSKGTFD